MNLKFFTHELERFEGTALKSLLDFTMIFVVTVLALEYVRLNNVFSYGYCNL